VSPDGTRVATAGKDYTARVWNAYTGDAVTPPLAHDGLVNTVAWSPDGKRVATASDDGTARIWNATTGKPMTPPLVAQGDVRAVAWSAHPGARRLSPQRRRCAGRTGRQVLELRSTA